MPTGSDNSLVFFVPGIMGSTLRFKGEGEYGQLIDEEIWGSNLWGNIDLLASNPARLASTQVEPGEVLSELRTGRWVRFKVYRELLNYCTASEGLSLEGNRNFYPFAYDWRADNRDSAAALARFILRVDPSETLSIVIIAHSMGGIVARLMLLGNSAIAKRTKLLFQIASPVQGSAKAFYTLKKRPKFDRIFDSLWSFFHYLDPARRSQLQNVLQGFPSLYQLLPPDSVKTIYDRAGVQYSAVDRQIWPAYLHPFLSSAIDVHKALARPLNSTIRCVYSSNCDTDLMYLVDDLFNIVASQCVGGDGTVCCSSAFAQTASAERHLITGKGTSHNELCHHPEVFNLLQSSLA